MSVKSPKGHSVIDYEVAAILTGPATLSSKLYVPTTGNTLAFSGAFTVMIVKPAGTLSALTIDLPASPPDGTYVKATCSQIVSTLTLASTDSSTIIAAPTSFAAGGHFSYLYNLSDTTWYPV